MPLSRFARNMLITLLIGVVLIAGVAATVVKAQMNTLPEEDAMYGETFSHSSAEARARGTLVAELQAQPPELQLDDVTISVAETWLEARALSTHCWVWWPCQQRKSGYNLYVRFDKGDQAIREGHIVVAPNRKHHHIDSHNWSDVSIHTEPLDKQEELAETRFRFYGKWTENPPQMQFLAKAGA